MGPINVALSFEGQSGIPCPPPEVTLSDELSDKWNKWKPELNCRRCRRCHRILTYILCLPRYTHCILWVYPPYTSHVCTAAVATFYFYN